MILKLNKNRYIKDFVVEDLSSKVVMIAGPRQVGKTTFAISLISPKATESHNQYLNWDFDEDRSRILNNEIPTGKLVVLDEIHKFSNWRNFVKGWFDKTKSDISYLVTGSARLDYYSKGGDSLDGRYFLYRLHPYTLSELSKNPNLSDLEALMRFGGFPEPLARGERTFHKRWSLARHRRIIHDDLRDLERVQEVSRVELLLNHLPRCVGSPLSIESLKNLMGVAHRTVDRWVGIMENLFLCYRVAPYGSPQVRAVRKEQKLYFWDWSVISEPGIRFENLVACHLLKYCHFREDTEGLRMELRYLRDTDGREVDFVVLADGAPLFAVECKSKERQISKSIKYFSERTPIPEFYQVHLGKKDYGHPSTGRVMPFLKFCKEKGMP